MKKAVFMAVALSLAPLPILSQEAQRPESRAAPPAEKGDTRGEQSWAQLAPTLRTRMVSAIEVVENACADDIDEFCGRVTPGAGRLAMCMRSHEDQLSRRCKTALERVSSAVEGTAARVTEMCWEEVRALCGEADGVGQCVVQKKDSLSPPCGTIVNLLGQRVQGLMAQAGMPVYSSDDKALGQVARVVKGPDGKVQSIQIDIGRMLGIGTKVVSITPDKFEHLAGIKLRLTDAEIRSLPEAKR